MFGSDESRSLDYKRAVVVDAEKKEKEEKQKRKTLLSKRKKCAQKSLTESALLEMSGLATTRPSDRFSEDETCTPTPNMKTQT